MSTNGAVLGINRRNRIIWRENDRRAVRLVRDKLETKRVLRNFDVPVPPTLVHVPDTSTLHHVAWSDLPDRWVMKPVHGSMGRGVLIARDRTGDRWISAGGDLLDVGAMTRHATSILDGEHTDDRHDEVLVEPLLVSHAQIGTVAPVGLPDIRVIVRRELPVMAMLRIPTVRSGGRGNLHQGGIGAAIDLATGRIERATHMGKPVTHHPESGEPIVGVELPLWPRVVQVAARCARATRLGYLGADIVVDERFGVLVLEVNAHPGLEIQNVCGVGLRRAMAARGDVSSTC